MCAVRASGRTSFGCVLALVIFMFARRAYIGGNAAAEPLALKAERINNEKTSRQETLNHTFHSRVGYSLCSIEITSSPILSSEFRPYPYLALAVLQEVQDIVRVRIEIVQVDCDDFLAT